MHIDIDRVLGEASRTVSRREADGAHVVVASRVYDTSQDDLWDAITNPERIPRWFLPISGDLRLGGRYQLEGNAGGEVIRCTPPRDLGLTWEMRGDVSWVNVELSEAPEGGTMLRLEHIAHVPDDFWDQFGPGAVGVGWDHVLLGLEQHLATHTTLTPENAAVWQASDAGKEFVHLSSEAWCRASIAAGSDPEQARAAADRTTAAYTGEQAEPVED